MDKWSNKIAVITGGSSGMGAAILKKLSEHNITVVNLDIAVSENNSPSDKVFNRKCDVSSIESIKENFKWINEKFGKVHILVNCAGIIVSTEITDVSDKNTDLLNKTLDINFRGSLHCLREAIQLMNKSNDYCLIVNLCSIQGHSVPFIGFKFGIYASTKHAIRALSETVRQELILNNNDRIRVSNISPGCVRTPLMSEFGKVNTVVSEAPLLEAEDVADSVIYLLSTPTNVNITELTIKPVGEKF